MNIILLSYGAAALGYLLLAALLLARWRGRPLGPAVLTACVATGLWALTIALGTLLERPPLAAIQVAEVIKDAGWILLIFQLLSLQSSGDVWIWNGRRWRPAFALCASACVALILVRHLSARFSIDAPFAYDLALLLWVCIPIATLLLIEQLYRNASVEERWGLKFLCLGLGVMATYDLFMYAQALLFRQLDPVMWQTRGVVHALALPWIAVAIARSRNWRLDLHVSRHVVFHTVTLMGAGLYLLCMAVIGYYIKYLGGSWSGLLQVSFLAASGALLLTLLFSGNLRARLRVWLSKNFFSYRYDYRVEWLRFTEELAALENIPPGIIRTMATIAMSPSGLLVYRDSTGQLNEIGTWGLEAPRSHELAALPDWIQRSGWVIDLQEWRETPDLYGDLILPGWLRESETLWLIVPLLFRDELEGLLFLSRTELKNSVNWEDRDLLKTAGRQAAALLAQQRASQAVVEARQFDAFNRLSAYVIHDLKNILAQQSLIVSNAAKHRDNPAFVDDMIHTVGNSVKRMQRLMDQMRNGMRSAESVEVDLAALLRGVAEARAASAPRPTLSVESAATVVADRERLATVFSHVVQNAQEATADDGEVSITLCRNESHAEITIRDSGSGMTRAFIRDQLFKPFESTKGLTGMGIGAFESREYVRQLGGDINVISEAGVGSCFTVSLPIAATHGTSSVDTESESCEPDTATAPARVSH